MVEAIYNTLRHKLGPRIVNLDYPGLRIVAHSESERFIRAHSAKKEPETVRWMEQMPKGSVLWDCGANIGAYSLIASRLGIVTIAIEPSPLNFASLCENIQLNELPIVPVALAIGNHNGIAHMTFSRQERGSAFHHLACEGFSLLQMTGERLIQNGIPKPDYLKIDTDGNELEILQGMGSHLYQLQGLLIEVDNESIPLYLRLQGFRETGRYPIPNYEMENRIYVNDCYGPAD